MNWQRIASGTAVAAVVLIVFDFFVSFSLLIVPADIVTAFLLTWLYVLARPRLGPGPKTALVMSSIAFFLASQPLFLYTSLYTHHWQDDASRILARLGFNWLKYALATYLAGWQYMEKAP